MPRYEITAHAEGDATLVIDAESEDAACEIAYQEHLTGIDIGCGSAYWEIDDVTELAAGDV